MGNQPWSQFQNGIRERSIIYTDRFFRVPQINPKVLSAVSSCHYNGNSKNGKNGSETNARPSGAIPTNPHPTGKSSNAKASGWGQIFSANPGECAGGWLWMKQIPALGYDYIIVDFMEAPSKVFLLFFLLPDWPKLNHLKSRMECGLSDIFSRHFCSTVTETTGVTNYAASFGAKKC